MLGLVRVAQLPGRFALLSVGGVCEPRVPYTMAYSTPARPMPRSPNLQRRVSRPLRGTNGSNVTSRIHVTNAFFSFSDSSLLAPDAYAACTSPETTKPRSSSRLIRPVFQRQMSTARHRATATIAFFRFGLAPCNSRHHLLTAQYPRW